jgi:rSAM/selenodomain-associated transferase 1
VSAALIVIAKAPVPGRVKTRLCPPCSPAQAARLAEAALADTLAAVAATPAARRVCALDGAPGPWLPDGFETIRQRGGGLRERLAAAFGDVGEPALLIGMDTPQLSPAVLSHAAAALEHADAALGLAPDGGYWAIGLRRPCAGVFDGVPMSVAATGAIQRKRLEAQGLRVAELPALRDVDDVADARVVARECAADARFPAALRAVERELAAPERSA